MHRRWDDGRRGTRQSGVRWVVDAGPHIVEKIVHSVPRASWGCPVPLSVATLLLVISQPLYLGVLLLDPSQEVLDQSLLVDCRRSSLLPLVPSLSVLVHARAAVSVGRAATGDVLGQTLVVLTVDDGGLHRRRSFLTQLRLVAVLRVADKTELSVSWA